ncbi:hypothetical protein B0I27_10715 [Arcticibacter pallidicorallinus]|uniref:T9SS C-terminal target domain-containing protein n=1 Tax=Arcticibacter pallidicorallinus TaxID=1259464 RepID=A0A2T0U0J7_9SPHI|nr:hypothetical protein [Arcticibacter pallidicorallinus]PRY51430.1 hypothetical protein B0I27_10715 [Arcticibacter pallidicorallinus]
MKKLKFLVIAMFGFATILTSCSSDDNGDELIEVEPATLSGDIKTNTTLTADKAWTLSGLVRIMDGATLTIEPGTTIKGDKATKAALIVERGGKINAAGTASKPIVFTSNQLAGQREIGDWAGVIICGKAPVNVAGGTSQYESGILGADVANYGGTDANDNSGILKYVRIEYAGIAYGTDREINSLTLAGVGSGTVLENIQVSFGGDDGFEFFGGTVNAKNLIAYRCTDDDFDFEFGYSGRIQYAISIKDPLVFDNSSSGASNGIECDNGSTVDVTPVNRPVLSNFTFIGPGEGANAKHNSGVIFRKGTAFVLRNSIIIDHLKAGFELATPKAGDRLFGGESEFKNNLVFANGAAFKANDAGANFTTNQALATFVTSAANGNVALANAAAAGITSTSLTAPNLLLTSASPAKTGADFTGLTGFEAVAFRGAMNTTDWTSGWASWTSGTNVY